ncbi:hypothetical protein ACJJIG_10635 [Microbulbifer sp. SSSA007]|uniref:hypothetical protein n=1 Tax=Microbulbifer sp. SSSA007 TaxID=3243379 RepID=UPI004039A36E
MFIKKISRWVFLLCLSCFTQLGAADDIAYLGVADGYWKVWRTNTETDSGEQLTQFGAGISRMSWYPDGRHDCQHK